MKLLTIIGIVFLSIHFSYADSDTRTSRRVGLNATFNGDPAPSIAGLNLNANAFSFLRISGGIGGYSSGLANTPRAIYNYTAAPLGYAGVQIVKAFDFLVPSAVEFQSPLTVSAADLPTAQRLAQRFHGRSRIGHHRQRGTLERVEFHHVGVDEPNFRVLKRGV